MAGYNPASNLTSNLPQSRIIYYDKKFVENLKANTPFVRCTDRRDLPLNSGNQLQLFMYNTLGANTTQSSEGTVGTGITVSVGTTTATIGEYSDYASFSSLALATSLDSVVDNVARELAYRLGQTLSAVVRAVADGASSVDPAVSVGLAGGTALSLTNIRSAVQSLAGRSVRPLNEAEDLFGGVIHPFVVGDLLNSTDNNNAIEILRYTIPSQQKMEELVSADLEQTLLFPATRVAFFQTNLVTITEDYQGSSGVAAYRTYIFGKEGVISIRLGARGDNAVNDGDWRNLQVNIVNNAALSVADPSGLIPGWTSYKVHFTATLPPDTTQRLRYIDSTSAIS